MRNPNGSARTIDRFVATPIVAGFAMALVMATPQESSAQRLGGGAHPGDDVLSFNFSLGGFFSQSDFAGGATFEDTQAAGVTATYWAHQNAGVRANLLWYDNEVVAGSESIALIGQDPRVLSYSGDLILRMPQGGMGDLEMSWYPYILGGIGGKSYDFETAADETDLAGNVGAGLELRFGGSGRVGVHTEVRDFISEFDRLGVNETLHDVVWTGGISLSF